MASLKKIMNVDEESHGSDPDKRDKEPAPMSSQASKSTSSTSNYILPTNASFSPASTQRQGQSSFSHKWQPLAPETTPSSPGASTGSRRRSITGNESMDGSYYGRGHGYPPFSASGGASGLYDSASGTGVEAPVKLTPITGRVSRAKKGVPVHVCELCRPPKTFTRAEHLRRHQLSHQPPDLACSVPGCDKVFHRRDLLERHQLRHEQEAKGQGEIGGSTAASPEGSGSPFVTGSGSTPAFALASSALGPPDPSHSTGLGLGVVDTDVTMGPTSWSAMRSNHNLAGNNSMQSSHGDVPGSYRMDSVYAASSSAGLVNAAYISSSSNDPWQNGSGLSSTSANNNGGTFSPSPHPRAPDTPGNQWTDTVASFPMAQRGVQSPEMDPSPGFYSYTTSAADGGPSMAYDSTMGLSLAAYAEGGSINSSENLLNGTTVRSLFPPLAVAQSSETLVTMPAAVPSERIATGFTCSRQAGDALSIIPTQTSTTVSLDRELRSLIPAYLNVYWDKVHPLYPVIHKPTFDSQPSGTSDSLDLLQCSMAAVVTQFLEDKTHRINGDHLHAYVWKSLNMFTHSEEWSLPIMQAVGLSEYYARFRGRQKESHRPSAQFAKLYQMINNHQNTFAPIPATGDSLSSWKQWIGLEARRRLLSGAFMLDVQSMIYYEQAPVGIAHLDYSSPSTLPIPLTTSSTKLWEAPDDQSWARLIDVTPPLETVNTVLSKPITAEDIARAPPVDAAILVAACGLRLPRRQSLTKIQAKVDILPLDGAELALVRLFSQTGIANTYLALHFTPLHMLLSVSGESWVFNNKIFRGTMFSEHRQYLDQWIRSESVVMAVAFASRALRAFLGLTTAMIADGGGSFVEQARGVPWMDLSDYWGVYVCALICWAYGQGADDEEDADNDASRRTGLRWILTVSEMEPGQLEEWPQRRNTLAVVCLARDVLARDCVGGRNILFADAVSVLRKLGRSDGWD